jgi:hypothetical protein
MPSEIAIRAFQAEAALRMLLVDAGLPEPDAIDHDLDNEEIVLRWTDRQVAMVVELSD